MKGELTNRQVPVGSGSIRSSMRFEASADEWLELAPARSSGTEFLTY